MIYTQIQHFQDKLIRSLSHCEGLIICSTFSLNQLLPKNELIVWNNGQKKLRWIEKEDLSSYDFYTLGRSSDMKYKVLRFSFGRYDQRVDVYQAEAEIFEFESNSWKSIDFEVDWDLYLRKLKVVSVGESSLWLAISKGRVFVQSFNFSSEAFRPYEAPPGVKEETGKAVLSSSGDNLFLLYQRHRELTEL